MSIAARFNFDRSRTYRDSRNPDPFGTKKLPEPKSKRKPSVRVKTPKPKKKAKSTAPRKASSRFQKITPAELKDAIARAPIVGISALAREYGVAWSTLAYHLKKAGHQHQPKLTREQVQQAIKRNSHPRLRHSSGRISVLAQEFGVSISLLKYEFIKAGYTPPKFDNELELYAKAFDEGYSFEEIAKILQIPVNTIKSRLRKLKRSFPYRGANQRQQIREKSSFVLTKPE